MTGCFGSWPLVSPLAYPPSSRSLPPQRTHGAQMQPNPERMYLNNDQMPRWRGCLGPRAGWHRPLIRAREHKLQLAYLACRPAARDSFCRSKSALSRDAYARSSVLASMGPMVVPLGRSPTVASGVSPSMMITFGLPPLSFAKPDY